MILKTRKHFFMMFSPFGRARGWRFWWSRKRCGNQKQFKSTFKLMVCYGHEFSNKLNSSNRNSPSFSFSSRVLCRLHKHAIQKSFSYFFSRSDWQQVHQHQSHKTKMYWLAGAAILMDFY